MLRCCPYLVLLAIVLADVAQIAGTDLWGHIRFGQEIIKSAQVPYRDDYSFTAGQSLWWDHEWLSQVLMALSYNALGVLGLKLFKFACAVATIVLLAAAEAESGAGIAVQTVIMIFVAEAIAPFVQFRPQVLTYVMFTATMLLLARHNFRGQSPLWLMVPLEALWVNLHGGYVVGLAALAAYGGTVLVADLAAGLGWRRAAYPCLVTAAATVATLLNPYGVRAWTGVVRHIADPLVRSLVEWQPLVTWFSVQLHASPFSIALALLWGLPVIALAIAIFLEPRAGCVPLVAVAALFVASTFASVRNLPLAMIAVAVPLARYAGMADIRDPAAAWRRALQSWRKIARGHINPLPEERPAPRRIVSHTAGGLLTLAGYGLALLIAIWAGAFSNRLKLEKPCPAQALSFMKLNGLRGNVLTAYAWSGYLIWHAEPGDKVFFDTRFITVYPPRVTRDYINFIDAQPGAMRALDDYPTDFVLVAPQSPAYKLMMGIKGWKLIYDGADAGLFARSSLDIGDLRKLPEQRNALARWFP